MGINIFEPQISVVSHSLEGKSMLIYGSNRLGKTATATKFPKPVYLAFESGINGIPGIPFFKMRKWSEYVSFVKQITNDKNLQQAKELYQTIILDEVSIMGSLCSDFICEKYACDRINDAFNGWGAWKEYAAEFEKYLHLLASAGFTLIFIAHEGTRDFKDENGEEYTKIYPRSDKRVIDPILDMVDIIGYISANGLDENGKEIKSSIYLSNTKKFHAGSRFDYLVPYIREFSAENLTNAIKEAIIKQEEIEGVKSVDYATQARTYAITVEKTYDELKSEIKSIAEKLFSEDKVDIYKLIVEEHLGKGHGVQDTDSSQKQLLELILADLEAL